MRRFEYNEPSRFWSHAEFARLLNVDPHTVGRWLSLGLLPKGGRNKVRFGSTDLNRLNLYQWFCELKETDTGRKQMRRLPTDLGCPRLWRFPAWITKTGDRRHPVLRAWERAHGGGIWQAVRRLYDDNHKGEADRWGFLLRFVASYLTSGDWPKTQKDFKRFLGLIEREFYPNHYLADLRGMLVSDAFDQKLTPHYEIAKRAGISFKPLWKFNRES